MKQVTEFENGKCYLLKYMTREMNFTKDLSFHTGFAMYENGKWTATDVYFFQEKDGDPWKVTQTMEFHKIIVLNAWDMSISDEEYKQLTGLDPAPKEKK